MEPSDDEELEPGGDRIGRGGPIPPHDRRWRHPAEIGEWERDRSRLVAAPPPLSRRLTAVIASASVAFSAAVLVISIPRMEGSDGAADVASTGEVRGVTTSVGAGPETVVVVPAGHFTTAESPAGGYVVAASDDVDGRDTAMISVGDENPLDATVVHVDELLGLALLEVAERALGVDTSVATIARSPESGDEVMVEDASGRATIRGRVGVGTSRTEGLVPLDLEAKVRGVRRAYAADGTLLGIAVRHHHATWLVTSDRLRRLLDVAGAGESAR